MKSASLQGCRRPCTSFLTMATPRRILSLVFLVALAKAVNRSLMVVILVIQ